MYISKIVHNCYNNKQVSFGTIIYLDFVLLCREQTEDTEEQTEDTEEPPGWSRSG